MSLWRAAMAGFLRVDASKALYCGLQKNECQCDMCDGRCGPEDGCVATRASAPTWTGAPSPVTRTATPSTAGTWLVPASAAPAWPSCWADARLEGPRRYRRLPEHASHGPLLLRPIDERAAVAGSDAHGLEVHAGWEMDARYSNF